MEWMDAARAAWYDLEDSARPYEAADAGDDWERTTPARA